MKKRGFFLVVIVLTLLFANSTLAQEGCCIDPDTHECMRMILQDDCIGLGNDFYFSGGCDAPECVEGCCVYADPGGDLKCTSDYSQYFCEQGFLGTGVSFLPEVEGADCLDVCTKKGILYGYVYRFNTNVPIPGAVITLTGGPEPYTATSQSSGYYFVADSSTGDIPTGDYEMRVTKVGYQDEVISSVTVSGSTRKDAYMKEEEVVGGEGQGFGWVIMGETGVIEAPLEGATLIIPPEGGRAEIKVFTDANGRFDFNATLDSGVPPGTYAVTVTYPGREPKTDTFTFEADRYKNFGKIYIYPVQVEAGDVVCCAFGCIDDADFRPDLGDSGICESGTGRYCTGTNEEDTCLKSANVCCLSREFCNGAREEEPNICTKRGLFGCTGSCEVPDPCTPNADLESNGGVFGDEFCSCGAQYYSTAQPGYCCSDGVDTFYSAIECNPPDMNQIYGRIFDRISGDPLDGVQVNVYYVDRDYPRVRTTNADGEFRISLPENEAYKVSFKMSGYDDAPADDPSRYYLNDGYTLIHRNANPVRLEQIPGTEHAVFYITSLIGDIGFADIFMDPEMSACVDRYGNFIPAQRLQAHAREQGEPDLRVSWLSMADCNELVRYEVYRRLASESEGSFELVAVLPKSAEYYDDSNVEWETEYVYSVLPFYNNGMTASPISEIRFSTGNRLCEGKSRELKNNEFCLRDNPETESVEEGRPHYRVYCDDDNFLNLTEDLSDVTSGVANCSERGSNYVCVGPNEFGKTKCIALAECGIDVMEAYPFGLFYDFESCYGRPLTDQGNANPEHLRYDRYCTMDRTDTLQDKCLSCEDYEECSDYKSKEACEIDNCYVSEGSMCVWIAGQGEGTDTVTINGEVVYNPPSTVGLKFGKMGEGICIRADVDKKRDDYCELCQAGNAPFNANLGCTDSVCYRLGACFSDGESCVSCLKKPRCEDYTTQKQCTGLDSGSDGISIVPSISQLMSGSVSSCGNNLVEYSQDGCGKLVCKWITDTGLPNGGYCIKDGNDNDLSDCDEGGTGTETPECDASNSIADFWIMNYQQWLPMHEDLVFWSTKNLSVYIYSGPDRAYGFMYCIDQSDTCCPSPPRDPSYDWVVFDAGLKSNRVVINPYFDFDFGKAGVSNAYDGPGIYNIRFVAIDRFKNFKEIETIHVYADYDNPVISVETTVFKNGSSMGAIPPESNISIDISVDELVECYDELRNLATGVSRRILGDSRSDSFSEQESTDWHLNYGDLADGQYRYFITCQDPFGNSATVTIDEIYVNAESNLRIVNPPPGSSINTDTPQFEIKTDDESYCNLNYQGTYERFNTNDDYTHILDYADLGISPLNHNKKYHSSEFYVECWDNKDGQKKSKEFRFLTDFTPPDTMAIMFTQDDITLQNGEDYLVNMQPEIYFECQDPLIEDSDEVFGCKQTYYCLTSTQDAACSPVNEVPENRKVLLETSARLCYYSSDNGDNPEQPINCVTIIIDPDSPVINLDTPSNLVLDPLEASRDKIVTDVNTLDLSGSITDNYLLEDVEIYVYTSDHSRNLDSRTGLGTQQYDFSESLNLLNVDMDKTKYTVVIVAEDRAGNVAEYSFNYYYDEEPPVVEDFRIDGSTGKTSVEYSQGFNIGFSVEDKQWTQEIEYLDAVVKCVSGACYPFEAPLVQQSGTSTTTDYDFDILPRANFGVYDYKAGDYVVEVLTEDRFGHSVQKTFEFEIIDTLPSTIAWLVPENKVSNRNMGTQFKFRTQKPSECQFYLSSVDPDEEAYYYDMDTDMWGQEHSYVLASKSLPDGEYGFTVICEDLGGGTYNALVDVLKIDTVIPELVMTSSKGILSKETQALIQEYFLDYYPEQEDLRPIVSIFDNSVNEDPIKCTFKCISPNAQCPKDEGVFGLDQFMQHQDNIFDFKRFTKPGGDYYYEIYCADMANNAARAHELIFRINGPRENSITEIYPEDGDMVNSVPLNISAKTNNPLRCQYTLIPETATLTDYDFYTYFVHRSDLNVPQNRFYAYKVRCEETEEPDTYVESRDMTFNYDTAAPNGGLTITRRTYLPVFDILPVSIDDNVHSYRYSIGSFDSSTEEPFISLGAEALALSGTNNVDVRPVDQAGNVGNAVTASLASGDFSALGFNIDSMYRAYEFNNVHYTSLDELEIVGRISGLDSSSNVQVFNVNNDFDSGAISSDSGGVFTLDVPLQKGINDIYILRLPVGSPPYSYKHTRVIQDKIGPDVTVYPADLLQTNEPISISTDEESLCSIDYYSSNFLYTEDFGSSFDTRHSKVLDNQIDIDVNGAAIVNINCRDKAANYNSEVSQIRLDSLNPNITSVDVDGYYEESVDEYKLVKDSLAIITINADEFVRCRYDFEDRDYPDMRYFSDDYGSYLLHPRIATRLDPGADDSMDFTRDIYLACEDRAAKFSDTQSIRVHVALNEPIIVFDSRPVGTINYMNPTVSVKTFRDADCTAKFNPLESSEGVVAYIFDFFQWLFSPNSKLNKQYMNGYYYHSGTLSGDMNVQPESPSRLEMSSEYDFDVTCEAVKPGIPEGEGKIHFEISYIDLFRPEVRAVYIDKWELFLLP